MTETNKPQAASSTSPTPGAAPGFSPAAHLIGELWDELVWATRELQSGFEQLGDLERRYNAAFTELAAAPLAEFDKKRRIEELLEARELEESRIDIPGLLEIRQQAEKVHAHLERCCHIAQTYASNRLVEANLRHVLIGNVLDQAAITAVHFFAEALTAYVRLFPSDENDERLRDAWMALIPMTEEGTLH